ncbi:o-succinylbenzoate--CoA ligase [Calidifontibacillus oryziterrae]|uniref:o-succinylbenzoate--CoA ligase n=1 Tax=Calidifontibacillus oryziterrae TaxID=1191699 RepID=UPI0002DC1141|nr:o-succinylbenzoate--CoA ligase [Calidifontibacillus oryziterrae]
MGNDIMPNWLEKRAQLSPDRMALIAKNVTWTFSELNEKSLQVARKLMTLGVKSGDHIAILLDNKPDFVAIIHGIEHVGAVAVLLNTRLTSHELLWQLNDANTKLLIFDLHYKDKVEQWCNNYENDKVRLDKAKNEITQQTDRFGNCSTREDHSYFQGNADVRRSGQKCISLEHFSKLTETTFEARSEWCLTDLHTIIYTSGTTGNPKGVMLTYGNHWWNAVGSSLNLGIHEDDRWLCCLPLFHVGGLSILLRSIFYGIPIVLHEKFEANIINDSIVEHKVTILSVVSQMLTRMIDELGGDSYPSHLRCVLLGGGPAPMPLLQSCRQRNIPLYQTYGMTETASQVATLSSEYMLVKIGSAGKPLFPVQLRIEKNGVLTKPGVAGEIVVKGPNVAQGYWNRIVESEKAIKDGWLYTGDIGYLDDDGFLFVLDRRSDLIISGGENIYPAEIESVLLAHPAVDEAGVIGMEDEKWGQVPVAFIKKLVGQIVSESEIFSYCKERLAKYKVPTQVYFVDELPRNASNKLMRHQLKQLMK